VFYEIRVTLPGDYSGAHAEPPLPKEADEGFAVRSGKVNLARTPRFRWNWEREPFDFMPTIGFGIWLVKEGLAKEIEKAGFRGVRFEPAEVHVGATSYPYCYFVFTEQFHRICFKTCQELDSSTLVHLTDPVLVGADSTSDFLIGRAHSQDERMVSTVVSKRFVNFVKKNKWRGVKFEALDKVDTYVEKPKVSCYICG
jgi:hypothetical protein